MARTWLSITVELIEGRGRHLWPRPGRIFAAARSHTFAQLAQAIDDAFARWDRAHLHEFRAIAEQLVVSERAMEKHVGAIFDKLDLLPSDAVNRRVRAVLTYLTQA